MEVAMFNRSQISLNKKGKIINKFFESILICQKSMLCFIFKKSTFCLHYCFILGTVYTTNYNSKLHCCGNNVYYSTTHLCCENGSMIEKTSPDHTSCCKKNATSFYSCKKQEKTKSDFCGKQSYDKKSDLCCNNEIHRGAHKMGKRCCNPGTLTYDPRNQNCCHGEVKRIAER